jgi:hypothetical protein
MHDCDLPTMAQGHIGNLNSYRKSYLLAYFDRFGPNAISDYARDYAEKKIDEFLTAMNLAGVSPRAARAYVQHCVSFSP